MEVSEDIKKKAEKFSFNYPSELFHQLPTEELRQLWRKETEDHYIFGYLENR